MVCADWTMNWFLRYLETGIVFERKPPLERRDRERRPRAEKGLGAVGRERFDDLGSSRVG